MSYEHVLDCVGAALFLAFLARWGYRRRDPLRGAPLRPHRLDVLSLLSVMLVYLLALMVLELAARPWIPSGEADPDAGQQLRATLVQPAASLIGGAACILAGRSLFRAGLRGFGIGRRPVWRDLAFAAVTYVAIWPGVRGLYALSVAVFEWFRPGLDPPPHTVIAILHEPQHSVALKAWLVFGAGIAAPLAEEAFFRGHVQTTLKTYLRSRWGAVLLTGLLFGAIHFAQPQAILPLFFLGCALGYAYERTGSLWCPIFLHAGFNAVTLVHQAGLEGTGVE